MLTVENLTVRFRLPEGAITALEEVSFTVRDGESVCVVGESGSGKSVLMQAVLGLLPHNAEVSGRILLDGRNLLALSKKEMEGIRGVGISYVPQGSGNSLNPLMKIGAQISEGIVEHGLCTKREGTARSIALLREFALGEEAILAKSYPHTLSGGMKQRVLLALGLAPDAPLLIADEPTKGLDSDRVDLVVESFRSLSDCTLLCVTHDLAFAQGVAQRIAIIYAGQLVEYADAQAFFAHPAHPYSQALLAATPMHGFAAIAGYSPCHEDYSEMCRFYPRCAVRAPECRRGAETMWSEERMVKCRHGFT